MPSENRYELDKALRTLRKERGLTQEEITKALGINHQVCDTLERDASDADLSTIIALVRLYNVSADYIFAYDATTPPTEEHCMQSAINTTTTSDNNSDKEHQQVIEMIKKHTIGIVSLTCKDTLIDKATLLKTIRLLSAAQVFMIEKFYLEYMNKKHPTT